MDDGRFDNLILAVHGRVGTRRALPSFLAGLSLPLVAGPVAGAELGADKRKPGNKQKNKRKGDPGVLYFEKLAAKLSETPGGCDALAQAAASFKQANLAEFNRIANREKQWDAQTRARVGKKNKERITRATATLHTLMASCQFRGTAPGAICAASGGNSALAELPGQAQCGAGCDCGCICPISGWTCAGSFFGCMGGSEASCCWFGACAGNICDEQCPNCCNCNQSCCGC